MILNNQVSLNNNNNNVGFKLNLFIKITTNLFISILGKLPQTYSLSLKQLRLSPICNLRTAVAETQSVRKDNVVLFGRSWLKCLMSWVVMKATACWRILFISGNSVIQLMNIPWQINKCRLKHRKSFIIRLYFLW